ncbi:hypothetical protein ACWGQ5_34400 [Streptomyces sp. NPDC055722]
MSHRPYPNRERARVKVSRNRFGAAAYRMYRRIPQRYATGADTWQPDFLMDGCTGDIAAYPVDETRLSDR